MAITTKVDVLGRDILVDLAPELSPEGRSATLASVAQEALDAARQQNARASGGQPPDHEQYVDGRAGAPFASVKPDGRIVIEFELQSQVVGWIWQEVQRVAPVLTGRFRKAHRLLADGVEVPDFDPTLSAEEWLIISTVPYARKLEGHLAGRPPLSRQAPEGVYDVVATMARRRFGNVARINFGMRAIEGGMLSDWLDVSTRTRKRQSAKTELRRHRPAAQWKRRDWLSRQPCIEISFR